MKNEEKSTQRNAEKHGQATMAATSGRHQPETKVTFSALGAGVVDDAMQALADLPAPANQQKSEQTPDTVRHEKQQDCQRRKYHRQHQHDFCQQIGQRHRTQTP